MDGRSTTLMIALALAATGLAGCIQSPDWFNSTDLEVTAAEHRGLADAAAAAWNEDAALVGLLAIETREQMDPRLTTDPEVGNGRAPAWWYVYVAEATQTSSAEATTGGAEGGEATATATTSAIRAFKVTSDGAVSSEQDAETLAAGFGHQMAKPVGEWTLDSDAALAKATADEGFRGAVQGMNATLLAGLAHHEERTAWWFMAASLSGVVVATVDAVTGELLAVKPFEMKMPSIPAFEMASRSPAMWMPEPIHIEGEGVATPDMPPAEFPFTTVAPMHGMIAFDYRMRLPTDGLHWAIMDAEGELVAVDHLGGWRGGGSHESEVVIEKPGDYTLKIFYMSSFPVPPLVPVGEVHYVFVMDLVAGAPEHEDEEDS